MPEIKTEVWVAIGLAGLAAIWRSITMWFSLKQNVDQNTRRIDSLEGAVADQFERSEARDLRIETKIDGLYGRLGERRVVDSDHNEPRRRDD
jgi:hypothetical protein